MVYNIHYTRPKWNGECLPQHAFGELNLIENFLIWQRQYVNKIDGIEALKESKGRSLIMIETPTGEKLFSFKALYKYWDDQGLWLL